MKIKVVFSKKSFESPTRGKEENEEFIQNFQKKLEKFGNFVGATKIEYKDLGNGEIYILWKGREKLTLTADGNGVDGGWLVIK